MGKEFYQEDGSDVSETPPEADAQWVLGTVAGVRNKAAIRVLFRNTWAKVITGNPDAEQVIVTCISVDTPKPVSVGQSICVCVGNPVDASKKRAFWVSGVGPRLS